MKKHLTIAGLALLVASLSILTGCEKVEPVAITTGQLVGLWGLSIDENPTPTYQEYVHFFEDGTFEYYNIAKPSYGYHRGTYKCEETQFVMTYNNLRSYVLIDSVYRLSPSYNDQSHLYRAVFTTIEVTNRRITTKDNATIYYHAATAIPSTWNNELSAPDAKPSTETLIGQWDEVSFYELTNYGTTWWYLLKPVEAGITLLADSAISGGNFWMNRVWNQQKKDGKINASEDIWMAYNDCRWFINDGKLTLTCKAYTAYTPGTDGSRTNERHVSFDEPLAIQFTVHLLTNYYCILYDSESRLFFAFHRHPAKAQGAPQYNGMHSVINYRAAEPACDDNLNISALFR